MSAIFGLSIFDMKTHNRKVLFYVLLFLLLQGCSAFEPIGRLRTSSDPYHGGSYKEAVDAWTREARIYSGLDLQLIAVATYKSPSFRKAYTGELARFYRYHTEGEVNLNAEAAESTSMSRDFVFAAYVPNNSWNDFSEKDSIWKVQLTMGEEDRALRMAPTEIKKLKIIDAKTRHLFPYITPWKSVYIVRFPAASFETDQGITGDDDTSVKLEISSVLGSAIMEWPVPGQEMSAGK